MDELKQKLNDKLGYGYQSKVAKLLDIEKSHLNRVLNDKAKLTKRLEKQLLELCDG